MKKLIGSLALLAIILISGCTVTDAPRPRPGIYATHSFMDVDSLGHHNYSAFIGENDGMVYTCRGGSIDIAHLRIAADNTYYLNKKTSRALKKGDTEFTYSLNTDPSVFVVHITYPANFKTLPQSQQEKIIDEVSLEAAQYFTWNMVTWHEILTWYGLKAFLIASQFQSAFAWEDSYSNLVGTVVGAKAIRKGGNYNDAMTVALKEELLTLDPQPAQVGYDAAARIKGKWYKSGMSTQIILRNIDIGLGDGTVSPALVPDICPQAVPMKYPIPTLETAERYGFKIDIEIKPNCGPANRCLKLTGHKSPIIPSKDLPVIMNDIEKQGQEMGYTIMK